MASGKIILDNNLNYPTKYPANELNLYLYGLPTISPADNKSILMATINFIKSTNRFSPYVLLHPQSPTPSRIGSTLLNSILFLTFLLILVCVSRINLLFLFTVYVVNFLGMDGVVAHFSCYASSNFS